MVDRGVGEAIAGLLAVDVAGCDRAGLGAAVTLAQRVRGWVDAVDVAIARRSRELAAEGRSESAAEVLTGYGRRSTSGDESRVGSVSGVSRCPASRPRWLRRCRPAMSTPSRMRRKGSMMPVGNVSASCRTCCSGFARVEPVGVFERRCRLLGKRLAGDEGEVRTGQAESGGVGATLGRQGVPDAPHPPRLGSGTGRETWSAIDAQLASIRQADGNSGTPIISCWQIRSSRRCPGAFRGSAGAGRSVFTSTTPRCSTASTRLRCVRPPMVSRAGRCSSPAATARLRFRRRGRLAHHERPGHQRGGHAHDAQPSEAHQFHGIPLPRTRPFADGMEVSGGCHQYIH